MIQITISPGQLEVARKVFELVIWPVTLELGRRSLKRLKVWANSIVTDNTNRVRDELKSHFDYNKSDLTEYINAKFEAHEVMAFIKLDGQDQLLSTKLKVLQDQLDSLIKILKVKYPEDFK